MGRLVFDSRDIRLPLPHESPPSPPTTNGNEQANYTGIHSTPLYINQINEAILRVVTGNSDLSIALTIHPMPREIHVILSLRRGVASAV